MIMVDCGVCLDSGDYEHPSVYRDDMVKSRKPHKCGECGGTIERGQQYQRVTGCWEGSWDTHYTCMDCWNIREAFRCGGGFFFGRLWDDLHEYRNDVNTGCVEKIKTVSAKQKYMDWLREVRGIDI